MRILIVSPFFSPVIGGVESVLDTTCSVLAKSGHSVQVLTSTAGASGKKTESRGRGYQIHRSETLDVPDRQIIKAQDFSFDDASSTMKQIVDEFDPAVIHFHNYQMKPYAMFLPAFFEGIDRKRYATLNTIHNDTDDKFSSYILSYYPLDQIITVTRKASFDLFEAGVPPSKITHVPNMLDVESYRGADGKVVRKMLGVDEDSPIILFPSRLVGREGNILYDSVTGKGLSTLLKALPEVLDSVPNAKVLLLGNDPVFEEQVSKMKSQLKEIAWRIGLGDGLLFFDQFVTNEMLPKIFAASDLVVSLSTREAFGMIFVEGMSAGKPVVGVNSKIGGVSEVIPDHYAGYLVGEDDPHGTAKAITEVLTDDELRARFGLNGIKWAKRKFDTKVVLPKLLAAYESVAKQMPKLQREIEPWQISPENSLNEELE